MTPLASFSTLSDTDLLAQVTRLAADERHTTAQLIASLAELDARRLYLGLGFPSIFAYCTQALRLSEHAAYGRIEAARAARRVPLLLDRLADGSITLTTVTLLAAHLTSENHRAVLDAAHHKSKREVEELVARLRPLPPVPSSVRKLPAPPTAPPPPAATSSPLTTREAGVEPEHATSHVEPTASSSSAAAAPPAPRPAVVVPLAPERYKVQVTVSGETVEKLRRIQDLMRHTIPNGDPAAIFDRALTMLLAHLERTKLAATDKPRKEGEVAPGSRHIPASVRRAVWTRDGGQCAFIGTDGHRCQERGFLEFHHTTPYAVGGEARVDSIELRCRAHNVHEAELHFGPSVRDRRSPRRQADVDAGAGSQTPRRSSASS